MMIKIALATEQFNSTNAGNRRGCIDTSSSPCLPAAGAPPVARRTRAHTRTRSIESKWEHLSSASGLVSSHSCMAMLHDDHITHLLYVMLLHDVEYARSILMLALTCRPLFRATMLKPTMARLCAMLRLYRNPTGCSCHVTDEQRLTACFETLQLREVNAAASMEILHCAQPSCCGDMMGFFNKAKEHDHKVGGMLTSVAESSQTLGDLIAAQAGTKQRDPVLISGQSIGPMPLSRTKATQEGPHTFVDAQTTSDGRSCALFATSNGVISVHTWHEQETVERHADIKVHPSTKSKRSHWALNVRGALDSGVAPVRDDAHAVGPSWKTSCSQGMRLTASWVVATKQVRRKMSSCYNDDIYGLLGTYARA